MDTNERPGRRDARAALPSDICTGYVLERGRWPRRSVAAGDDRHNRPADSLQPGDFHELTA